MIAIIAKPPFIRTNELGSHVVRISSRSRGEEISEYLGAEYNQGRGDVTIFVKPHSLRGIKDGDYVDILDDPGLVEKLRDRPKVKVIAMSQAQFEYLGEELPNDIFLIPHHHINFERVRNKPRSVLTGGIIGHSTEAKELYERLKTELSKINVSFIPIFSYTTRQDSVDFFKKIDFLVAWNIEKYKTYPHSHPTKLINAGSFGVPTVSQPMAGYKEFPYIQISDNSLKEAVEKLKDPIYYKDWSDKVFNEAEKYHISNISKLYRAL